MGNNVSKSLLECKKSGGKRLTLDNCSLSSIPKNAFKDFPNLISISLNSNQIGQLPGSISKFQKLEILRVEENKLSNFPKELGSLSCLTELDAVSNELRNIPENIDNLKELKKVVFQNNRIKIVPEGIGNLLKLNLLYLAENDIQILPSSIGNLSCLSILSLYENQIKEIPPEIGKLENLKSLNISSNAISYIPPEIGNIQGLVELFIFNNKLQEIPVEIGSLTALNLLDVSENEISIIPDEIGYLTELRQFNIAENKITEIPKSIGNCDQLEMLKFSHNQIKQFPIELQELIDLKELHVEDNQIESIPSELDDVIEALVIFSTEGNPFHATLGVPLISPEEFEESVWVTLCAGGVFKKYNRKGKTVNRLVYLDHKSMRLQCRDAKKNRDERDSIRVDELKEVLTGMKTPTLKKYGKSIRENCYLSLISDTVTLDLEIKAELRDEWANMFKQTIAYYSNHPIEFTAESNPMSPGVSRKKKLLDVKDDEMSKSKKRMSVFGLGTLKKKKKSTKKDVSVTDSREIKSEGNVSDALDDSEISEDDTEDITESPNKPRKSKTRKSKRNKNKKQKYKLKEDNKEIEEPDKLEEIEESTKSDSKEEPKEDLKPKEEPKKEIEEDIKPKEEPKTAQKKQPRASIMARAKLFEQTQEEPTPLPKKTTVKVARPVTMYNSSVSPLIGDVEKPSSTDQIKTTYTGQTAKGSVRARLAMFETIEEKAQREAAVLEGKRLEEQRKEKENRAREEIARLQAEQEAKEEAERKAKEADKKAKEEAEQKAKEEAECKAKEEADRKAKEDSDRKAKEEVDRKAKEEADRKAKEEADRKAKEEADRKAKEEAERKVKEEADRKAKEEADRLAKEEADRLAKEEADRKAKEEADRKAKEEADRLAKEEADRKAKEEAERKAKEEAERKAKEEADRLAREEEERKKLKTEEEKKAFEEKQKREAEERRIKEEAERKAKEEAERLAKEEAERKAKEEAERKAKEEAERKAKEEAERLAKEEAERKAKEEAERKAKEEAERKAKEEAERKAKEEAERKAKEEADRLAKEEAERKAKEEAERLAKEEADRKAKEEAERLAKEEADRKAKEEADRKAKEEADRKAKEEADRLAKEEADKKDKEGDDNNIEDKKEISSPLQDNVLSNIKEGSTDSPKIIKRAGGVSGRRLPTRKGGNKLASEAASRLKEADERRQKQMEEIARRREENMKLLQEEEEKLAKMTPEERKLLEEKELKEQKEKEEEEYAARLAREEKEREEKKKIEMEREKVAAIQGALGSLKKASTTKRVEPPSRLICLKGKRRVRVHLVEVKASSLNHGDVFILDKKTHLYIWNGQKANRMEKAKGAEISLRFKNQERKGATIVRLDPGDTDEEFWKELGGSENDVRTPEEGGNDIDYERECDNLVKLYKIEKPSNGSEDFLIDEVSTKRLSREILATDCCFILDSVTELYVWVGKGSTSAMRTFTMNYAKTNILETRPDWTHFARNVEGGEEILFREKFSEWPDRVLGAKNSSSNSSGKTLTRKRSMLMGRIKKKEVKIDANKLHTAVRPEPELLGDGTPGTIEAWIGVDGKLQEEHDLLNGHFYSAESYVILYTFTKGNSIRYHIYFWQGLDASRQDKGLTALLVKEIQVKVRKEKGAEPFQERVTPLKEPYQFLTIFKGKFCIHSGKKTSHQKSKSTHFYRIQSTCDDVLTRAIEIPSNISLMNSRDSFIAQNSDKCYCWFGSGTTDEQKERVNTLRDVLIGSRELITMNEGNENKKFWKLLSGKKTYANASYLKKPGWEPRFYFCTGTSSSFKVDPIWDLSQHDLDPTCSVIVDVISEVYVWTGAKSPEETKKKAMETATEYVRAAFDGRLQNTPIYFVPSGQESNSFIALFSSWDDKKQRGEGKLELVSDKLKDYDREYTWEELTAKVKPKGLDMKHLEKYLPDSVFEEKFGMTKEKFWGMPSWKRTQKKKKVGFF